MDFYSYLQSAYIYLALKNSRGSETGLRYKYAIEKRKLIYCGNR